VFLEVGSLLKDLQEDLLVHFRVVLIFTFELDGLHDVEVSAEEHEPIDVEFIEGLGDLIEDDCFWKLVLTVAAAVVVEDDAELVVVHVHHFQRFLYYCLLFFQKQLAK
jgi:hypothetical protein